jgi:hypothetical protein
MPLDTGEHNRLDRNVADHTAERLKALFTSSDSDLQIPAPDTGLGSPHLVSSLDEAPRHTIQPVTEAINVYAVDGGSSVLARGGNIEVVAWRAGMVHFRDRKRIVENCPPPEILAYNRLALKPIFEEYLVDLPIEYTSDQPPLRPVDELRWMAEWRLISNIVDNAEKESLLLIDGSLRANNLFGMKFQKDILINAAEKKVHIAAVTKRSSLSLGGSLPMDLGVDRNDSESGSDNYWYRRVSRSLDQNSGWLGDIYLARLHPGADKTFRVDITRFDKIKVDSIFSMITALADDVEFCGYPYPLAAAHRLARIDNYFRRELIESIGRALERRKFPPQTWEYLTGDIHDKLNADIQALAQDQFYG